MTAIEQIQQELPSLDWITDPLKIGRLSQDFSWFSPVLKRQLLGKRADIVVKPRTEDEIRQVASACARHRIPLTVRGSGTGNYGQSTPLHGGVILDMSGYNAFLWSRPGVGRAQAGIRLAEFDNAARPTGWELRCIPPPSAAPRSVACSAAASAVWARSTTARSARPATSWASAR